MLKEAPESLKQDSAVLNHSKRRKMTKGIIVCFHVQKPNKTKAQNEERVQIQEAIISVSGFFILPHLY